MSTTTKQPETTGARAILKVWEEFDQAAKDGKPFAGQVHYCRNAANSLVFEQYWNDRTNREYLCIKVLTIKGGDSENKMTFTARTTGATLVVYERR